MRRIVIIAGFILTGVSVTAMADVYRWVDAQGRVHYSDRWVPGAELVKVSNSKPSSQDVERVAREQAALAESNARIESEQLQAETERAVQQDIAKVREQQCKEAKQRYQMAIQSRRLFRLREDGEREYMSEAEADAYRVQARTEMEEVCGS
jgi:C-terminal processing protease CtpA/Prc